MSRRDFSRHARPHTSSGYTRSEEGESEDQEIPQVLPVSKEGIDELAGRFKASGANAESTSEPDQVYSEEEGINKLREKMAEEQHPHKETRAERSERNKREWAERNSKNKESTLPDKSKTVLSKAGKVVQDLAGGFAQGGKEVFEEMYGPTGSKPKSKGETPVLKGTTPGSPYRVDDGGYLYVKDKKGQWINTGKKTKFKIPKTVVDEETGLEVSPSEPSDELPKHRIPRGSGGLGGLLGRGISSGSSERSSGLSGQGVGALAGASRKKFGVGLGRMSAGVDYGMYSDEKAQARLADINRVKKPYMAGMSYLSAGGRGGGYSEEKAQARLDEINRVKTPYAAGMNYLSAGNYSGNRPVGNLGDTGKDVDAFSSGLYRVSYGNKKATMPQQPVTLDQQIDQLQQIQVRQAKIKQIQQLQEETGTSNNVQPLPEGIEQYESPPPQKEPSALEMIFGMRNSAPSTRAVYGGSTPTMRPSVPRKSSATATEDFFGLRTGNGSQLNSPEMADVNRSATASFFGLNKPKRYPIAQQQTTAPTQNQQYPKSLPSPVKLKKLPKSVMMRLEQTQTQQPPQNIPQQLIKKPREMTAAEMLFSNR